MCNVVQGSNGTVMCTHWIVVICYLNGVVSKRNTLCGTFCLLLGSIVLLLKSTTYKKYITFIRQEIQFMLFNKYVYDLNLLILKT